MNIVILCLVVVLATNTNCYILPQLNSTFEVQTEDSVLIRRIQSSVRNDSEETTSNLTWSEILADVLIHSFKILHDTSNSDEIKEIPEHNTKQNIVNKFCSEVLNVYKRYVYDKFFNRNSDEVFVTSKSFTDELDFNIEPMELSSREASDFEVITLNPDVEIFGPKYHGKLCSDCKDEGVQDKEENQTNDCPEGLKRDAVGKCGDPKSSNFITSVPFQCPLGYRRDWFGYCKPNF
ncbi:uncharacterized protein [Battus philenor]|uniref:uncharacterized protein n=1 Tax=Battus philenor TaxID=42288 RepID=UPI0035D07724